MDAIRNPYTPNAGARPPALVGRDELIHDFEVLFQRVKGGSTDKGLLITGLRGVGKTVLLNRFREIAIEGSTVVVFLEISKIGGDFPRQFSRACRQALFSISPRDRWRSRTTKAAQAIKSFSTTFDPDGSVRMNLGVEVAEGQADSGAIVQDLPDVVVALGEAALEHGKTIVLLFDEIQYLSAEELTALVMAKHQINQLELPIVLSGAGLPSLPTLTGQVQTYAERMFTFPKIGKLDAPLAKLALTEPAAALGIVFTPEAASFIVDYTEGYPFFIQEFGRAVWNEAEESPITLEDAQRSQVGVDETIDRDFYSVRIDAIPKSEKSYLLALASLGSGEHTQAAVAQAMGVKDSAKTGARASRLISASS